jgi:molybdate transport system substrate-binding protein
VFGGCRPGASAGDTTLTVFAAASLTESFTAIAEDFEAANEGIDVVLNFGPSDGLATQIREGAPADVFASASPYWMDAVAEEPGVTERIDFATNELVIVAPRPPADRAVVGGLGDLGGPDVKLVLAAEGVPAGDYARQVLADGGIAEAALANVVSNEEDVKGVVQKVLLGEADAGIVYRTDVTPAVALQVRVVEIPSEINVTARYPIAVVRTTDRPALARGFVMHVMGPGQEVLQAQGFGPAE